MQEPLLHAVPDQHGTATRDVPDMLRGRGFLYPRWWIIAALCFSVLIAPLAFMASTTSCSGPKKVTIACAFISWHPIWQVVCIWLPFFLFWAIALLWGVRAVEVPRRRRSRLGEFFRSISQFGPLHTLLLIYGLLALAMLVVMWLLQKTTPVAFATTSIIAFVASCDFLYRMTRRERRTWLIIYGVMALLGLTTTVVFQRFEAPETPYMVLEGLLVLIGVRAIFWRLEPDHQLTAQEALEESLAQSTSPLYILRSTWPLNRLFPNRPAGTPPGNSGTSTQ